MSSSSSRSVVDGEVADSATGERNRLCALCGLAAEKGARRVVPNDMYIVTKLNLECTTFSGRQLASGQLLCGRHFYDGARTRLYA